MMASQDRVVSLPTAIPIRQGIHMIIIPSLIMVMSSRLLVLLSPGAQRTSGNAGCELIELWVVPKLLEVSELQEASLSSRSSVGPPVLEHHGEV